LDVEKNTQGFSYGYKFYFRKLRAQACNNWII